MTEWFVDNTKTGGTNTGVDKDNAWLHPKSAYEHPTYDPDDIIHARGDQTHIFDTEVVIDESGALGRHIIMRGDDGTVWPEDYPAARPIFDFSSYETRIRWQAKNYWTDENVHFRDGENDTLFFRRCANATTLNCIFTSTTATPDYSIKVNYEAICAVDGCTFDADVGTAISLGAAGDIRNSTIDNADIGVRVTGQRAELENVVFGGTTPNAVDIQVANACVFCRNVIFNAPTEVDITEGQTPNCQVISNDHNGVPGAWKKYSLFGNLTLVAASSTDAGQRTYGGEDILEALAFSMINQGAPFHYYEQPIEVTSGTKSADIWIQPHDWTIPPVTQGANAEVYVLIKAWNNAQSKFLVYDSREEASQLTQVNDTWQRIRVTGIDNGRDGNIYVSIFQNTGDSSKLIYIDRIMDVA